jgi:hypothetical protein
VRIRNEVFCRQPDGEITARLPAEDEKMELSHEGSPSYRKAFYILVSIGAAYLAAVFFYF